MEFLFDRAEERLNSSFTRNDETTNVLDARLRFPLLSYLFQLFFILGSQIGIEIRPLDPDGIIGDLGLLNLAAAYLVSDRSFGKLKLFCNFLYGVIHVSFSPHFYLQRSHEILFLLRITSRPVLFWSGPG